MKEKNNQTEKVFKIIGASNHCKDEREATDFYSTDPDCVKDLLELENFNGEILEPCCGSGNISKVLEEAGYSVSSTDLYEHGYGKSGIDLFTYKDIDSDIITNPPFGIVTEFIEHMLNELKPMHKMALFLKLQFLEGQERYRKIFNKQKLKTVYVYTERVVCFKNNEMYLKNEDGSFKLDKNGKKKKVPSAVAYAWYIFDMDYNGYPTIKWITPKEDEVNENKCKLFELH
jgi:hypothetical protein